MLLEEKKLWPGKDGNLVISEELLSRIGTGPDGSIYVTYLVDGCKSRQEIFVSSAEAGGLTPEALSEEAVRLVIPQGLLEEAGIQPEEDLDVVCESRRISIIPGRLDIEIPHEVLELCAELGISPEKVRIIMEMEGLDGRIETNLSSDRQ